MTDHSDQANREDMMSVAGAYGALGSLAIGLALWAVLFVFIMWVLRG